MDNDEWLVKRLALDSLRLPKNGYIFSGLRDSQIPGFWGHNIKRLDFVLQETGDLGGDLGTIPNSKLSILHSPFSILHSSFSILHSQFPHAQAP
jgi:hypothetical protein